MVVDLLMNGLKNPAPAARIEMLRVVAMLEETRTLATLRNMMTTETDPNVLSVLKWAGSIVWRAQQSGYSTEAGMQQVFRIEEKPSEEQRREEELLARLQYQFDMEQIKDQDRANKRKIGRSVVMGAFGAALTGPMMSATMLASSAGKVAATSTPAPSTGERPVVATQFVTPQRPTTFDTSAWMKRAGEGSSADRQKALIELRAINNPAVLPFLGYHFALGLDDAVKNEAQRAGKMIYFNWVYWAQEDAKTAAAAEASQSEVAKILAKAEAARESRKKK